jgi:hypothetical protein
MGAGGSRLIFIGSNSSAVYSQTLRSFYPSSPAALFAWELVIWRQCRPGFATYFYPRLRILEFQSHWQLESSQFPPILEFFRSTAAASPSLHSSLTGFFLEPHRMEEACRAGNRMPTCFLIMRWTGSSLWAKIHSPQKCYPCLRNKVLPMSPERTQGVMVELMRIEPVTS